MRLLDANCSWPLTPPPYPCMFACPPYSTDHRRHFFWPLALALFSSGCVYFGMSQDQGWIIVHGCRQMFFSRYLDGIFGMPLIVMVTGMVSGGPKSDTVALMGMTGACALPLSFGLVFTVFSRRTRNCNRKRDRSRVSLPGRHTERWPRITARLPLGSCGPHAPSCPRLRPSRACLLRRSPCGGCPDSRHSLARMQR